MNAEMTIAIQALQLLMFAPVDVREWVKNGRKFGLEGYARRYPTPIPKVDGVPIRKQDPAIGQYSYEDLSRAITLLYYNMFRRSKAAWQSRIDLVKQAALLKWQGYYNPDLTVENDSPTTTEDQVFTHDAMLRSMRAAQLLEATRAAWRNEEQDVEDQLKDSTNDIANSNAEIATQVASASSSLMDKRIRKTSNQKRPSAFRGPGQVGWEAILKLCNDLYPNPHGGPDITNTRIQRERESFAKVLPKAYLDEYMTNLRETPHYTHAVKKSVDKDVARLEATYRTNFLVDATIDAYQPPQKVDFKAITLAHGMSEDFNLYPGRRPQTLLPHQVADIHRSHEFIDKGVSFGLNLYMGLGKTKIMLALIETKVRENIRWNRSVEETGEGEPRKFKPSLMLCPVAVIMQTAREAIGNNPHLKINIYYGDAEKMPKVGATHLKQKGFDELMKRLASKQDDVDSGRHLIITSYDTWRTREVRTTECRFLFANEDEDDENTAVGDKRSPRVPTIPSSQPKKRRANTGAAIGLTKEELRAKWDSATQYSTIEINKSEITEVSVTSRTIPDGNLKEYQWLHANRAADEFQFLLCDEAHIMRNASSVYNRMVSMINREVGIYVTGTPVLSTNRDIVGIGAFIWDNTGIDGLKLAKQLEMNLCVEIIELWRDDYDPMAASADDDEDLVLDEAGDASNHAGTQRGQHNKIQGILHESFPLDIGIKTELLSYYEKGVRIWEVCPQLLLAVGKHTRWRYTFSNTITSRILDKFCVSRGARCTIEMPDGSISFPGIGLPNVNKMYHEVIHTRANRSLVYLHGKDMASSSFASPSETLTETVVAPSATSGSQSMEKEKAPQRNYASLRGGQMVAHDARFTQILKSDLARSLKIDTKDTDQLVKLTRATARAEVLETESELRNRLKESAVEPIFGTNHVKEMIENDLYGGLGFFYAQTNREPANLVPDSSMAWLHYLIHGSPIAARVLQLLHQYVYKDRKKVVIFVDLPVIQMYMCSLVRLAGIETYTVRSTDKATEREMALSEFLSEGGAPSVFIANISIMGAGVNLQKVCSTLIFINFHTNERLLEQAGGRVIRLGQEKNVDWHTIKVVDSYHDYQEETMLVKWVLQLSVSANTPKWTTGLVKEVLLFELARLCYNHPFNRMAWVILRECSPRELSPNLDSTRRLGYAMSCVAKLLYSVGEDDEEDQEFWNSNISQVFIHVSVKLVPNIPLQEWYNMVLLDPPALRAKILEGLVDGAGRVNEYVDEERQRSLAKINKRFNDQVSKAQLGEIQELWGKVEIENEGIEYDE